MPAPPEISIPKFTFWNINLLVISPEMLTESFVASVLSSVDVKGSSATVPVVKDAAIFSFNLNPHFAQTRVLKKSSTTQNALALSDSHVFAAQADKAVIHVYNREKGSQEATIPVPEKITVVAVAGECGEYLVIGTQSGRVMVWEVRPFSSFILGLHI
jgi:pre-rRNA-processing protein IPI3